MIRLILPAFFLFFSCAQLPSRLPASFVPEKRGEVDHRLCLVKAFPKDLDQGIYQSFYLELKDSNKQLIDVAPEEIKVSSTLLTFDYSIFRLGRGRYEVKLLGETLEMKNLLFEVQAKEIKHSLSSWPVPSRKSSHLRIISSSSYELLLELSLKDRHGQLLEPLFSPELLVEGDALVTEVMRKKKGIWHIRITYPEDNQILYFSVRANGVNLSRLLRFQHIEK